MKYLLIFLFICTGYLPALAQNHLVTHNFIRTKVTEGYFMQRSGTSIPADNFCITKDEARNWLHLNEYYLPTDNRMPWWIELVPGAIYNECEDSYNACRMQNGAYSTCGTWIYQPGFDLYMASFTRSRLAPTNSFWVGVPEFPAQGCTQTPPSVVSGPRRTSKPENYLASADTLKNYVNCAAMPYSPALWEGPLNRCGTWSCSASSTHWLKIEGMFLAPATKTYYIGASADNFFRVYVDGDLFVANEYDEAAHKIWHVFPVTLTEGQHTIAIWGRDEASGSGAGVAMLGCELYDNTPTELAAATSTNDLRILFTTEFQSTLCLGEASQQPLNVIFDIGSNSGCCVSTLVGIDYSIHTAICAGDYVVGEFTPYSVYHEFISLEINNQSGSYKTLTVYIDGVPMGSYQVDMGWGYASFPGNTFPMGNITFQIY